MAKSQELNKRDMQRKLVTLSTSTFDIVALLFWVFFFSGLCRLSEDDENRNFRRKEVVQTAKHLWLPSGPRSRSMCSLLRRFSRDVNMTPSYVCNILSNLFLHLTLHNDTTRLMYGYVHSSSSHVMHNFFNFNSKPLDYILTPCVCRCLCTMHVYEHELERARSFCTSNCLQQTRRGQRYINKIQESFSTHRNHHRKCCNPKCDGTMCMCLANHFRCDANFLVAARSEKYLTFSSDSDGSAKPMDSDREHKIFYGKRHDQCACVHAAKWTCWTIFRSSGDIESNFLNEQTRLTMSSVSCVNRTIDAKLATTGDAMTLTHILAQDRQTAAVGNQIK